jgi:hypothetical protein
VRLFVWVTELLDDTAVNVVERLVEGAIELAITGIAVTLKTTPATRKPRDPTTTNRRGAT